jgi:glycosyltransferase involved in cell wall biosynthesis
LWRHIRFAGWRERPEALLAHADVLGFTSSFEGLPFAALEALAMGVPVLAPAVDGFVDFVPDGGGWLVEPNDPADMARKMVELANDRPQLEAKADSARQLYERRFTIEGMVDRMLDLYESRLPRAG